MVPLPDQVVINIIEQVTGMDRKWAIQNLCLINRTFRRCFYASNVVSTLKGYVRTEFGWNCAQKRIRASGKQLRNLDLKITCEAGLEMPLSLSACPNIQRLFTDNIIVADLPPGLEILYMARGKIDISAAALPSSLEYVSLCNNIFHDEPCTDFGFADLKYAACIDFSILTKSLENVRQFDLRGFGLMLRNFPDGVAGLKNVEVLRVDADVVTEKLELDLSGHEKLVAMSLVVQDHDRVILPKSLEALAITHGSRMLAHPDALRNGPRLTHLGFDAQFARHVQERWFLELWNTVEYGMVGLSTEYTPSGYIYEQVAGGDKSLSLVVAVHGDICKSAYRFLSIFAKRATFIFVVVQGDSLRAEYREIEELVQQQCPNADVSLYGGEYSLLTCQSLFWNCVLNSAGREKLFSWPV